MSRAIITPAPLSGRVAPPASKSDAHRLLICAALAHGISRIHRMDVNDDIAATIRVLESLGARITLSQGEAVVRGIGYTDASYDTAALGGGLAGASSGAADCGESGSTLRFLLPVAAALGRPTRFTGRGRLPRRPMDILTRLLSEHGAPCRRESAEELPLVVDGQLQAGEYRLPGDVSSQYVTGLLLALPLTGGESRIILTAPLQSAGYVDMTIRTMAVFGVEIQRLADGYRIPAGCRYRPVHCTAEADWSAATFFLAAGAMGGQISLAGLSPRSAQGDKAAATLFARFGADIRWAGDDLQVSHTSLHGAEIDVSQVPDMAPALAVCAAFAEGESRLTGGARLRLKESDRLSTIAGGLNALGVHVRELPDGLIITGTGGRFTGGDIDGAGDHRIVMAFSVAAAYARGESCISCPEAVAKSYPAFYTDFTTLGGIVHVI